AQMLKVGAQVGCNATALEKFRRPERGAPVSYRYSFEDLLALLHGRAPAKVDAVALHRRRVEHGHLSVGLKIHCLGGGRRTSRSKPATHKRGDEIMMRKMDCAGEKSAALVLDRKKVGCIFGRRRSISAVPDWR